MRYMTVKEVLDYVDEIKRNSFSRDIKLVWLNEIECRAQTDVMLLAAESVTYVQDDDAHALLVPMPWAEIYYDYLLMKLSEHLEESSEQNNRAATFNKAFTRFMRWWADTYEPAGGKALFKGYYLKGDKGEKGEPGTPGEKGESGTPGAFRVNVAYSNGVYTADKTFTEIKAAYDAGQQPFVVYGGGSDVIYTLAFCYFSSPEQMFMDFERQIVTNDKVRSETLRILSYTTNSGGNVTQRIEEFEIPAGGVLDNMMSDTSTNAVQNRVIKAYVDEQVGNINALLATI